MDLDLEKLNENIKEKNIRNINFDFINEEVNIEEKENNNNSITPINHALNFINDSQEFMKLTERLDLKYNNLFIDFENNNINYDCVLEGTDYIYNRFINDYDNPPENFKENFNIILNESIIPVGEKEIDIEEDGNREELSEENIEELNDDINSIKIYFDEIATGLNEIISFLEDKNYNVVFRDVNGLNDFSGAFIGSLEIEEDDTIELELMKDENIIANVKLIIEIYHNENDKYEIEAKLEKEEE